MRALFTCIALVATMATFAQVSVQLQAPRQAEVGDKIRISYVVNTTDVDNFEVGDFDGFDLLYGPSTSSQHSVRMVNGKTTKTSNITYTYMVQPTREGVLTIPVGTANVEGKSYTSQAGRIEVLPAQTAATGAQGQGGAQNAPDAQPQGTANKAVGDKDVYMELTASKTKVFEQEAVLLTYKLYTLVNVQQLSGEMPQLDGCHVQEVGAKAQMQLKYERVNGRNYGTAVWRQYVLYPQKTGKMEVPSITFDAQIEVVNRSQDPFDIFFGGGQLAQLVKKQLKTPALSLDVQALPQPRPEGFCGAVGSYTFSGSLSPLQLKANDAATLRLAVSGHGNMHLMKQPTVNFPKDFELYDPKKDDKSVHTAQGARGTVTWDYVVVPRHGGTYEVPPVEFCYFDTDKRQYVTLKTEPYHVTVEKGSTEGASSTAASQGEDLKVLGNDIRFIHMGAVRQATADAAFFASTAYWAAYAAMALVFGVLLVVFRHIVRENADNARRRVRGAGKAAGKRLRNAAQLMHTHQSGAFYEEVMRALLGYAGDKLGLPTAELGKDNVCQALAQKGVELTLIDAYIDAVEQCEFARFAPGDPNATMERIYSQAESAINRLDAQL